MLTINPKTKTPRTVLKAAAQVPDTHIFCRLGKVDVASRTVYGRAVQEVPDASGEIFDYAKSKPYFESWVKDTREASAGKSLGNIRAMHGNVAAGKAVEVVFQDDECAIDIAAKIVDDNEWNKVLEGVYTGFSIGGAYVGEKVKEGDLMRYTAAPIEISLVDVPCIPTAMFSDVVKSKGFDVVKEDKTVEHKAFAEKSLEAPADPVAKVDPAAKAAKVDEVETSPEVAGTKADVEELATTMATHKLSLGDVVKAVKTKVTADAPKRFADAANKKYPLDNAAQVTAAWFFVNTAKAAEAYKGKEDELEAMKEVVKAAWIERFKSEPEAVEAEVATKALGVELTKGFWNVSSAANMLSYLAQFMGDMEYYEEAGMVADGVTGKLCTVLGAMGDVVTMILSAAITGATDDTTKARYQTQYDALTKAGARHSAVDNARLQSAYDLLVELGATPSKPSSSTTISADPDAEPADGQVVDVADKSKEGDLAKGMTLAKAVGLITDLTTRLEKFEAQPRAAKAVMRVVDKAEDSASGTGGLSKVMIEPVLKGDGTVDAALTLMKLAQQLPVGSD